MNDQQQSRADALTDRSERVESAMKILYSAFIDCTIYAQDALALHAYVEKLERNIRDGTASPVSQPAAAPADGACKRCGSTTAQACNDAGCFYLESGDGEPSAAPADERAATVSVEALCERLNQYPIGTRIGITAMMKLVDEVAAGAAASPAAERVTAALQALSADVHTLGDGWANDEAMIGLAKKYLRVEPKSASPELSLWRDFVLLAVTDTAPQPAQADALGEEAYVAKRMTETLATVYATIIGDDEVDTDDGLNAIERVVRAAQVLRLEVDLYRAQADAPDDTHKFKNFHRRLCERFGYVHDEIDWRRDQVSLIEWIAKKADAPAEARADALALLMERDAWKNAMQGLCREWFATPDAAAAHLRVRLHPECHAPAEPREPLNEVLFGNDESLEMAADALDRIGQNSAADGVRAVAYELRMLATKRSAPANTTEAREPMANYVVPPVTLLEQQKRTIAERHFKGAPDVCRALQCIDDACAEMLSRVPADAGEATEPVCWIERDQLANLQDLTSDAWVYWRETGHVAEADEVALYAAPPASRVASLMKFIQELIADDYWSESKAVRARALLNGDDQ